ncbi:hypothetical protein BKA69DRAFT_1092750 [Paraphysoderma sedebokerense]|nr:hypothetical protein BKA69DRAFT_1092750 [Paraphysoderma sedebokerense]
MVSRYNQRRSRQEKITERIIFISLAPMVSDLAVHYHLVPRRPVYCDLHLQRPHQCPNHHHSLHHLRRSAYTFLRICSLVILSFLRNLILYYHPRIHFNL